MTLAAAGLAVVLGLTACADGGHRNRRPPVRPEPVLFYSPNGEPLNGGALGQPSCKLAMATWFDRVDANHDGQVDRAEFLADARAQFAGMDLDHLGYVTAEELERFRAPYRSGTRPSAADPVMSADTDVDFKVTPEEFLRQAEATFDRLDAGHAGAIGRSALPALCPKQSEQRQDGQSGRRGDDGWPPF